MVFSKPFIGRFTRYIVTGLANTGISYIVYSLFLFLHAGPSVALAASYAAGMVNSYFINSRWTFGQKTLHLHGAIRFLAVNAGLLMISELALRVILRETNLSPYVGQAINLVPQTILGFLANQWLVFGRRKEHAVSSHPQ